jgi:hypothetical protein
MAERWHPDYRDEHLPGLYPFADGMTLVAEDGLALDPAAFLDASAYPIGGGPGCALTAVEVSTRLVRFWIGDDADRRRASATFDPLAPPTLLALADTYGRPAGVLLVDPLPLAASQAWPGGAHEFPAGTAEFVASCVLPTPEVGVRGFLTAAGDLLTGDVWWVGERGVVIRTEDGAIRIDVVGDPLFARRLCFPLGLFATPRFVRTINGVPPGPDGDFKLIVGAHDAQDTILRIYPVSATELAIEAVGETLEGS